MYSNYKKHYELDAQFIVPPQQLPPSQRASEKRRLQTIVRLLPVGQTGLKPGETPRVLDIGCGSGWLARNVATRGLHTIASDLSLNGVRKAKAYFLPSRPAALHEACLRADTCLPRGGLSACDAQAGAGTAHRQAQGSTPLPLIFLVTDIYDLPFSPRSFDVVLLSEVCEHLEDIDAALEQVRHILKDRGTLILTVPYRERIKWHLCIHCNRLTPANAHLHSFDERRMRRYLERHGLNVIETLKLSNKFLEALRVPRWTMWMPYVLWRAVDCLFNAISGRSAFLCVLAERTETKEQD